jgi:ketosteroid isomerase-like protein
MKNCIIVFLFITGLLSVSQTALAGDEANATDHEALRALRSKVEKAIASSDMALLASCLTKEFVIITSDQAVLTSKKDLDAYWNKMFNGKDAVVTAMTSTLSPSILTKFSSSTNGFCYGTSKDRYTLNDNEIIEIDSVWSVQLTKEDGEWKIESAHAGVNFIDNPVLEAKSMSIFKRLSIMLGISSLPGEVEQ